MRCFVRWLPSVALGRRRAGRRCRDPVELARDRSNRARLRPARFAVRRAATAGIDIAAAIGSVVLAPDDGVVTFAGKVGGRLFLTIDHGAGVTSTCSWLTSVLVRKSDRVTRDQPVATTGWGHTDLAVPHLHFGVRLDGAYVDPLAYLGAPSVSTMIRLAPLDAPAPMATGRMTGLAYPSTPRVARLPGGRIVGGARARGDLIEPVAAVSGRRRPFGVGIRGPGAPVPRRLERPGRYR